ncbi:hypothetical protein FXO38_32475 [Capsicum annuum]|nr:hypothetical protein FXO38_32475 [Capsicum annuum]
MMNQTWSIMRRLRSSLPHSQERNRTNKNQQKLDHVMVELLTTGNLYYVIDDNSFGPGGMIGGAEYRHVKSEFSAPIGSVTERTVMSSIGEKFPFTSSDSVKFFSNLEMHLRQDFPSLCCRDHMAYRSAYFPVKTAFLAAAATNLSGAYTGATTSGNDISSPQKKEKEVDTLLPLDEPLDASTPNKELDDILETFSPEHRPIVEFALDNIQRMKLCQKLQQQENRDEGKNKRVRGAKDGDQPKNRCVKGAIFVDVDEQKNKKKGKKPRGSKQELKGNQEETKHGSFGSEISDNAFLKVGHKEDVAVRTKKRKFENLIEDEREPKDCVPKELSTEKVVGSQVIGTSSSISVVSTSKGQTNMTPKNMNEKSAPGSATKTGFLEAATANFYGAYTVTVFMLLNVLLHEFMNNLVYTIASTEQSTKDDSVSDTEDEDIDIDGKSQQAEGVDSELLEEDNQTEVNFDEEVNIVKKNLQNFISLTSIGPPTSANDISSSQKKETVFISKLLFDIHYVDVKQRFSAFGEVEYFAPILTQVTKRPRGTGFLKFKTAESTETSISTTSVVDCLGVFLKGRQLNILKALDKKVAQDKELHKTKNKDNDHRNLYLTKKGLILEGTPAAEGVSVSDMYKNKGGANEQIPNEQERGANEQDGGVNEQDGDANGGVIKHKRSSYRQRPNMTPKNIYDKQVPGSATEAILLVQMVQPAAQNVGMKTLGVPHLLDLQPGVFP